MDPSQIIHSVIPLCFKNSAPRLVEHVHARIQLEYFSRMEGKRVARDRNQIKSFVYLQYFKNSVLKHVACAIQIMINM